MVNNNENFYSYLRYVTLSDAWREIKTFVFIWLLLSAICIALNAATSPVESIWEEMPRWLKNTTCFAACIWLFSGEKVSFPHLIFKLWATVTVFFGLFSLACNSLPSWVGLSLCIGLILIIVSLEALVTIGKSNYAKLTDTNNDT